VKSTFKRHVVSLKWKMGQKEIKIAVSVDRTRDLQIFSLTLSQLSYPRLLDKVVNLFFQSMFFPFPTASTFFLSVPVLFLFSRLLCFFVSLCCSARKRHTETEMGMSFKEEFVFGLFPILYWVLLSPGFVCVFILSENILSFFGIHLQSRDTRNHVTSSPSTPTEFPYV
jgi:hypothetical protein